MRCIKTGCVAWCEPYEETLSGDLYELTEDLWLMRVSFRDHNMDAPVYHASITEVHEWFDKDQMVSTMICSAGSFDYNSLQPTIISF